MIIKSPVTLGEVLLERTIDKNFIINKYKNDLDIDVSKYFNHISEVKVYRCVKTGYRFYYPDDITGDSLFYEDLQQKPWYYKKWKWEHEKALSYIHENQSILEIGSADGIFLKHVKDNLKAKPIGVDLNANAVEIANSKGIESYAIAYNDFVKNNNHKFDVICAFQVMEHIYNIKDFIINSLQCLNDGGRLILSVPNNDSKVHYNEYSLNLPPHHMGLWNKDAIGALAGVFQMEVENIYYEPLQHYHMNSYLYGLEKSLFNNLIGQIFWYQLSGKALFRKWSNKYPNKIMGHSLLAVFRK